MYIISITLRTALRRRITVIRHPGQRNSPLLRRTYTRQGLRDLVRALTPIAPALLFSSPVLRPHGPPRSPCVPLATGPMPSGGSVSDQGSSLAGAPP